MKPGALHIFITREAYLLIAASMFFGLFVSLSLHGLIPGVENNPAVDNFIVLFGELVIALPAILILRQRKVSIRKVLPLNTVSTVTVIMSIIMVLGVIGLVSVFEVLVTPIFPVPDFLKQLEQGLYEGGLLANVLLIVAATLAAPLIEEFLFRGLLQQSLFYSHGSLVPAIVIPAIVFALFHVAYLFYLPALVELLCLAVLLAWLILKTGNILIPILVHALFNLSAFTGLLIGAFEDITTLAELGWPWIITSILLFGAGWIYFKYMPIFEYENVYQIPLPHEVEN